jgi:uncharacterized protein with PQ loop repeat
MRWRNNMELGTLMSTLQLIGGIVLFISYLPLIRLLHKTKSAENQSLGFWIILDIGMMLFEVNALYLAITLGQYSYAISQSLNLLCGIIVLVQLLIYRKNK